MRRLYTTVLVGLLVAGTGQTRPAGDSLDKAEAAKRGVPVELVLFEREQTRSAALKKQLDESRQAIEKLTTERDQAIKSLVKVTAELSELKSSLTPLQKREIETVAHAIKSHELAIGMTVEEANRSLGVEGKLQRADRSGASEYEWVVMEDVAHLVTPPHRSEVRFRSEIPEPYTVHDKLAHRYTALVQNSKIISFANP